jgi:hypothetical protein
MLYTEEFLTIITKILNHNKQRLGRIQVHSLWEFKAIALGFWTPPRYCPLDSKKRQVLVGKD